MPPSTPLLLVTTSLATVASALWAGDLAAKGWLANPRESSLVVGLCLYAAGGTLHLAIGLPTDGRTSWILGPAVALAWVGLYRSGPAVVRTAKAEFARLVQRIRIV